MENKRDYEKEYKKAKEEIKQLQMFNARIGKKLEIIMGVLQI